MVSGHIVEVAGGPSLGQHQHRQTLQSVGNSHAAQGALQGAAFFNLAAFFNFSHKGIGNPQRGNHPALSNSLITLTDAPDDDLPTP